MTDPIIFGRNAESKVVSVFQTGDASMKIIKRIGGVAVSEERKFYPFFFVNDISLLKGFEKKFWEVELAGNNYYRYLCIFKKWTDMRSALRKAAENLHHGQKEPSVDFSEIEEIYVKQDPIFQFLMQTGITLFKDMEFSELRRMQLDIETFSISNFSVSARPEDRIILISLSDNSGWEYVIDGREKGESVMLNELVDIIKRRDPDVIEGHNIYNFDLPYILRRCEMCGVKLNIGRDSLEPKVYTSRVNFQEREIEYSNIEIPGRHIIDTWLLVQGYDSTRRELESYGLKNVAKHFGFASQDRTYIEGSKISETWLKNPDTLVRYALDDVRETRMIAEHLSQTSFYVSQMLPYNYGQIPRLGSAAKIESLFVREYLRKKHSIPKPQIGRQTSGGYTDVYMQGLFGPVVHADVESLYPSIMLSYKISPGTDELGVFQKTLKHLTKLRLDTKKEMREELDSMKRFRLDAMQSSLKILINSFYGYLGYSRGIFNDYKAADMVTETGQKILRQMISQLSNEGAVLLEVDTDGLYFVPPREHVGEENERGFITKLSRTLPQGINLSLDGRYEKMLSYKKKNYALLGFDGKIKVRGSSLISRSMERFGRDFIQKAIEYLLHENVKALHDLYVGYSHKILSRELPTGNIARTETVRESTEEYEAAVRANRRNRSASFEAAIAAGLSLRAGERVTYYIVGSDPHQPSFMNARIYDPGGSLRDKNDETRRDYNTQYYIRKLDEYAKRFFDFFEPEDFQKIFSTDEGSLFAVTLDGIKIRVNEVGGVDTKIEEEEE
ncbi:MAG TPA: DNA polymerase domain-containing protein [Candidatus Acidoferrales bacterium]|nr:DNA polymerase domain-containing protein [Candidatus Acidoferrales bacterium]